MTGIATGEKPNTESCRIGVYSGDWGTVFAYSQLSRVGSVACRQISYVVGGLRTAKGAEVLVMHVAQHVDPKLAERLMLDALGVAREGMMAGEAPIGCVLARGDGTIVSRGHNEQNRSGDRIAHAEIVAFHRAAGRVPREAKDLIMVSTLEPCVMCTGAAMEAAVNVVVFGLRAPADCGTTRVKPPSSPETHMPWVVGGVMSGESRALFERWLPMIKDPMQLAYVRQLLALTGGQGGCDASGRPRPV